MEKKNVAILISGHIRTFVDRIKSLKENLIDILLLNDYDVDIYISTWNNIGKRINDTFSEESINICIDEIKLQLNPKIFFYEPQNMNFFIDNYNTTKYNKKYSTNKTSPNAVCMWYKVNNCFDLLNTKRYTILFRLRPDLEYYEKFNVQLLQLCEIDDNIIFMPEFDGKYNEVRKGMVDHLAFGSYNSMKYYCELYKRINEIRKNPKCIHTGEGFLSRHILDNKSIKIKRTNWKYSIIY